MPSAGLIHIMALGQGIEVKNKLLESAKNNSNIDRRNSVMMDICAAHEAKTKSPPNTQYLRKATIVY